MRASAAVVAEMDPAGGGKPRLVELRSAPPLTLRWADGSLYIVGGAFAPLGGDELELDVHVGAGAALTIRTVAASVAQPGRGDMANGAERTSHGGPLATPGGPPSRFTVTARVAAGATLRWLPEPGVAVRGCHHVNEAHLELDSGAEVTWREEVLLGRHGQPGGEWRSTVDATLGGEPLLCQDTLIGGPVWDSSAVGGGARAAGSLLLVGPDAPAEPSVHTSQDPGAPVGVTRPTGTRDVATPPGSAEPPGLAEPGAPPALGGRAAAMPLASPGAAVISALAPDARTLRHLLHPDPLCR